MEAMAQMRGIAGTTGDSCTDTRGEISQRELTVGDIMSRDVFTVTADETISRAAKLMSENNVSCLIIMDQSRVTGILTEKDVLKGIAKQDVDFRRVKVAYRMSSPVEVVTATVSVLKAGHTMESLNIKRLPVLEDGRLAGIVTQTDITRGLVSLCPLRSVSDIMATEVATVQADASITEAARLMAAKGISCIVALHRQDVAGILTEKDLLKRVVALQKDPSQTQVADVMSFPIISVSPEYSVLSASKKLNDFHLHRLVVTDGNEVRGIVTQTDLMRAIRKELDQMESKRRRLTAQLAALAHRVGETVESACEFSSTMIDAESSEGKAGDSVDRFGTAPNDMQHGRTPIS